MFVSFYLPLFRSYGVIAFKTDRVCNPNPYHNHEFYKNGPSMFGIDIGIVSAPKAL